MQSMEKLVNHMTALATKVDYRTWKSTDNRGSMERNRCYLMEAYESIQSSPRSEWKRRYQRAKEIYSVPV